MDLEASAPLRPGAAVDLVLRAVGLEEPLLVTLRFDLPGDVAVLSGAMEKRHVPVKGLHRTEELTIRVKLPDDGQPRRLGGFVAWERPDPDAPEGRRPLDGFSVSLQTLAN